MKRSNAFPEQPGPYIVKVKNGAGWHAYDTARLQISVGQEYHEGEKFEATIHWVKHRFDKVIICVNDTLQRHNLIFRGMDKDKARSYSAEQGDSWIERNRIYLDELGVYELYRWSDWTQTYAYKLEQSKVINLFKTNSFFRDQVEEEMLLFWERAKKKNPYMSESRFHDFRLHSTMYLLEECAVFQLMFKHCRAVDIYPGSTLLPCKLSGVKDLGERGYTRIDFSRKDQAERIRRVA